MLKKYGIFCENCNVLLNNEDNIFGTNFGQLFHSTCMDINHGKSADCQPQMLFKMNLKFADTPTLTTETEREIMELKNTNNAARQTVQQLEAKIKTLEDALLVKDRLKGDLNKLMDCVVKIANTLSINIVDKASDNINNASQDKSNKKAYDENNLIGDDSPLTEEAEEQNIEHSNSNSGVLPSVQHLEARIKTLEEALLKLTDCVESDEKNKADKASDGGNNITQDPKASTEAHNENNLSGELLHNDTENTASASEGQQTFTISEEIQEVLDLRWNCVLIRNPKRYCKSLDEALSYVRELANEMNARIADNSVIHIKQNICDYYVYFCNEDSKKEFLKNRFIYKYNPNTGDYLRILDYTNWGIVDIENFQSSDWSLTTAYADVLGLAKKMRMKNIRSSIDYIDVYSTESNFLTYSVRFNSEEIKNAFVQNKDILKEFPETKSLMISDVGGHTSSCYNVNYFNLAQASANVIGVTGLMGLSLSTDNVKHVYVLNVKTISYAYDRDVHFSLVVEFSSNDIKKIFLKTKSELCQIENTWSSYIDISDIKPEGNIVSIKYYKHPNNVYTAVSFIGLAKQLGFSFTPDQTERFFELSEFIWKTSS